MTEILKAILFGIVEGITEWLPISSTGHMIILNEFISLKVREEFWNLFLVVIQLGAIMAVMLIFWKDIWPFWTIAQTKKWQNENQCQKQIHKKHIQNKQVQKRPIQKNQIPDKWMVYIKPDVLSLWIKIIFTCIPAGLAGLLFDDYLDKYFYNFPCVAGALILFGILFLIVEKWKKGRNESIYSIRELDYQRLLWIGVFQLIAAVFPGTSRSGATIVGALMVGVSREAATQFTFFLAVPVMLGAGILKLFKFLVMGLRFTGMEMILLFCGMAVAFLVSVIVIKFLLGYIKKHDFSIFGIYRIVLGGMLLVYYMVNY